MISANPHCEMHNPPLSQNLAQIPTTTGPYRPQVRPPAAAWAHRHRFRAGSERGSDREPSERDPAVYLDLRETGLAGQDLGRKLHHRLLLDRVDALHLLEHLHIGGLSESYRCSIRTPVLRRGVVALQQYAPCAIFEYTPPTACPVKPIDTRGFSCILRWSSPRL